MGAQTVCTLSDLSKNKMETPPKSPPTNHQHRSTYPYIPLRNEIYFVIRLCTVEM